MIAILGVDPGLASLGWGLVHFSPRPTLVCGGTIRTDSDMPVEQRLLHIGRELGLLLPGVDVLTWEQQSGVHHGKEREHETNAKATEVLKVEGLLVGISIEHGCQLVPVTAAQAKRAATGRGDAEKRVVKEFVNRLPKGHNWPKRFSQHAADGCAIALAAKLKLGARGNR